MDIQVIPMLNDNYSYLIVDQKSKQAVCIDPVEPDKAIAVADKLGSMIVMSLTTHSHWDHAGGNAKLKERLPYVEIIGGANDNCPACTREVAHGDTLELGSIKISVIGTPCHTSGHVCFYCDPQTGREEDCAIFTGDTMFVAGCGNFNSGTPAQMVEAFDRISQLPPSTMVYVGHEYTVKNLQFATFIEPENAAAQLKLQWAQQQRKNNAYTVPSSLLEEQKTNPFSRIREPAIRAAVHIDGDDAECMRAVRASKDAWGRSHRK